MRQPRESRTGSAKVVKLINDLRSKTNMLDLTPTIGGACGDAVQGLPW